MPVCASPVGWNSEEWYVSDLVLDETCSRVAGIVAYDTHAGTTHAIAATHVIMATGGAGRLFHTTSNSYDLTGDGMALALQAGLQLEDIEFIEGVQDLVADAVRRVGGPLDRFLAEFPGVATETALGDEPVLGA